MDSELQLKLARKSIDVFGSSVIEEGKNKHQVDFGCDDDTLSLQAGKEFALMLTSQGRVHYTGRVGFLLLKFSFSKKATKICAILLMVLTFTVKGLLRKVEL